jgi:exopolysaccharide biosynthesis polyprenyl glycosylphosphotransferase
MEAAGRQEDRLVLESGEATAPAVTATAPGPVIQSRHRDRDFALRRALLMADLLGLWLALAVALELSPIRDHPLTESLWILPVLPLWGLLFWVYRLYGRPIRRFEPTHLEDLPSLFHALVIGILGLWLYYKFVPPVRQLRLERVVIFGATALPLIAVMRAAVRAANFRARGPERVFAVAPPEDLRLLQRKLKNHPEYEMRLVGALRDEAGESGEEPGLEIAAARDELEDLMAAGEIEHLVVCLDNRCVAPLEAERLMQACHRHGVRFSCFLAPRGLVLPGMEVNYLEGVGILTSNPPVLSTAAKFVKRGMDIALSGALLVLLAPLFALIAVAIKLDSRGPVFYRQVRVGRNGRRFRMLKFRSMALDADTRDEELMKDSIDPDWLVMVHDPRVTPLGRFLRRNSLDELPQLWNVLKGEMSMVGPRPLSLRDDCKVQGWQRNRLDVLPGITGYWQVLGRNNMPFREMLEVDYAYVAGWSLWHDIKLLLQTFPTVIRRRGAN